MVVEEVIDLVFARLRDHVEGSAVDTHRRLEAEKAHLPTSLWKMS